jgi:hypothetical protein
MAGHSDSEIENSYSDESEFKEKESEILLGLSNGGIGFHGHGEGTFVCPFCHGKKVPSWSLRKLLQHANRKSHRDKRISRPEHSALAKYILTNDAMAHDCTSLVELGLWWKSGGEGSQGQAPHAE